MADDPVASMTMDPGGVMPTPVPSTISSMVPTLPPFRSAMPSPFPITDFGSDGFAVPLSFRPDTDRFIGPAPVPALANFLVSARAPSSQYAPAVVPSRVPGYRTGNGIGRVVPAGDPETVNVGRPQ